MISPLVIRLTVNQLHRSGAETGRLYAWSTLGCIVGILGTGWCFIEWLGVYRLTALCAAILLPLPFLLCSQVKSGSAGIRYGLAAYAVGALLYLSLIGSPYDLETRYFSIKVLDGEREGRAIKRLALDHLVHSEVDLQDPHWLGYKHEEIQGEFTRHFAKRYAQPEVLMIGGGGYTFPRWMEHQPELQKVRLQVVEIDPGVTEMAHRSMGFSRQSRVISHHLDGRQFVRKSSQGAYHLLIQDAVNDYSVPYHLMTREYNQLIQRSLAPQGVYLLTVIDSITEGPFLRAALRTMQQDFPEVRVLSPTGDWHNPIRSVYVLAGFTTAESCEEVLSSLDPSLVHVLPPSQAAALLARDGTNGLILTDRHAPVDNLMAGAYLTSGGK
jgi:hypothetical protein